MHFDQKTTMSYRWVASLRMMDHMSQKAYDIMRSDFVLRSDDVCLVGAFGCGRTSVLATCLALRQRGGLDLVDMDRPYTIDVSVARGRMDVVGFDQIDSVYRVFKFVFHPRWVLPLRVGDGDLPERGKFIYVMRDPRDVLVSNFCTMPAWKTFDPEKLDFESFFDAWLSDGVPNCNHWLAACLDWWEKAKAAPHRILWIVFEDMLRDPRLAVSKIAQFLGHSVEEAVVAHLASAMSFAELCRRWKSKLGPLLRKGIVGDHQHYFSNEQLARFRHEVLDPAISAGVPLPREVLIDRVAQKF